MIRPALLLAVAIAARTPSPGPVPGRAPQLQQAAAPAAAAASRLDYEVYRTKVQPILIGARKGNARCSACHSRGGGNAYLEPLPQGGSYTDEQSRRNFERVSRLVVPGEPLKSVLLMNPLAEEAGGSHWHGGGKHWSSQDHPEWRTLADWVRTPRAEVPAKPALSYEVYRTKVQPILIGARKGNARCSACHSRGGGNAYLEPLPPGGSYTDEQSRRNFERVSRLVVMGDPLKSVLLTNPLAEDAGGSHWHGGGKHWSSQDNPEWRTLADWVRGN
jgi:mono/diheme cytochrome c family protein